MHRVVLTLTLATLIAAPVGCTRPDPELSRLAAGDMAIIYNDKPEDVAVDDERFMTKIAPGTKVRIVSDSGPETDWKRVVISLALEGKSEGKSIGVERYHLRRIGQ